MFSINLETLIALSRERYLDLLREAEIQQLLQQNRATGGGGEASPRKDPSAKPAGSSSAFAVATESKPT